MLTPSLDPGDFQQKVQQIKKQVSIVLTQHGLLPRFSSWRLTQDPQSGLAVLFGSLNEAHIAAQAETAPEAYFDPILLLELSTDLQVQIIPSNNEGLRYAFILDRGHLDEVDALLELPALKPVQLPDGESGSTEPIILVWAEHFAVLRPGEEFHREHNIVSSEGLPRTLPRPRWETKNDGPLMRLGRMAVECVQAASLDGVGRRLGLAQLILFPETAAR
jgi:hypothetical protein